MIADLKQDGFHISLWQLPYFVPKNTLFPEILEKGLAVRDAKGNLPYEDAVLDFSNPATVAWYQEKIAGLLQTGRGRDQGGLRRGRPAQRRLRLRPHRLLRAQPLPAALQQGGRRHHQAGDRREHHLGAQRLGRQPALPAPLGRRRRQHRQRAWLSDAARRAVVRPHRASRSGATTSAASRRRRRRSSTGAGCRSACSPRTAAATARRPRNRGSTAPAFMDAFRRVGGDEVPADALRLRAGEGQLASAACPMLRALFVEYPGRPRLLAGRGRIPVRLGHPGRAADARRGRPGATSISRPAAGSTTRRARPTPAAGRASRPGRSPVVMLVRDGAAIPHAAVAQSTAQIDWSKLELVTFAAKARASPRARVPAVGQSSCARWRSTPGAASCRRATPSGPGEVDGPCSRRASEPRHPHQQLRQGPLRYHDRGSLLAPGGRVVT